MKPEIITTLISSHAELASGIDANNKIDAGYLSENYILESSGIKYFLKCYRFPDKRRISDAHKAKYFFFSKGIPVILPIKNKEGETIQQIGDRYFSLFPFISGHHFVTSDVPSLAPKALGSILGRIHVAGEKTYPDISEKFKSWNKKVFQETADAILDIINEKERMTDFDVRAKQVIEFKKKCVNTEKLEYKDMEDLRVGLIHGDYHNGNVFFDASGSVTHVFDFEKTCIAPFVFEIVRAIRYSHVTGYGRPGSKASVSNFIEGYMQERMITDMELQQGIELFYQHEIHGLWVEKEHYLKGNSRVDKLLHTEEFLKGIETLGSRVKI